MTDALHSNLDIGKIGSSGDWEVNCSVIQAVLLVYHIFFKEERSEER